ncbi:hypothetical protein [Acidipropionibacterium jensenii]|uniref:hypothetical protein n=1 Tax=Acidipropionibacterium jensenii TaxID=1749 RepID=UPI00214C6386|nr:hypothetical protein [Acidipropionibacterium jensenii]
MHTLSSDNPDPGPRDELATILAEAYLDSPGLVPDVGVLAAAVLAADWRPAGKLTDRLSDLGLTIIDADELDRSRADTTAHRPFVEAIRGLRTTSSSSVHPSTPVQEHS